MPSLSSCSVWVHKSCLAMATCLVLCKSQERRSDASLRANLEVLTKCKVCLLGFFLCSLDLFVSNCSDKIFISVYDLAVPIEFRKYWEALGVDSLDSPGSNTLTLPRPTDIKSYFPKVLFFSAVDYMTLL